MHKEGETKFVKRGKIEGWTDVSACKNLLFFSQLVNELLFDYSIPSNRIATLNSHFLCVDALSAIDGIDNHGVPEGTIKPIMEELYETLQKDPIFKNDSDKPTKYFVKYQNDRYRISSKISELNYEELKKATYAINTHFFGNNRYYTLLKNRIIDLVVNNCESDQPELFRLVKAMLTELVNLGYSTKYIHNKMDRLLWNPLHRVDCPDLIRNFFEAFDFIEKEYVVLFVVQRSKMQKFVSFTNGITLLEEYQRKTQQHLESIFLNKGNNQAFLQIKMKAFDPFMAADAAKVLLTTKISFYRLCDHSMRYDISGAKCGVYDGDIFIQITQNLSGVSHTKMPSTKQITDSMVASERALNSAFNRHINDALTQAVLFHAQSLKETSAENQLLDLWAIFESVLDISNRHTSDRINQVCMYLIPILKRRYIYSLFQQLANDIKNYSEDAYSLIADSCTNEKEIIHNLCKFVIMPEFKAERDAFLSCCADFPLLKERIQYYESTLASPIKVYEFVEKHAERVKWQVMRIYRNRNLIVHNGDSMPYMDLLIENLHSYVDDFLSFVIHNLAEGHTVDSMCQKLFARECDWLADFSNRKATMTVDVISRMLEF